MATQKAKSALHILGSGSIGMLWASSIRSFDPSYPVTMILRSHRKHQIDATGMMKIALCHANSEEGDARFADASLIPVAAVASEADEQSEAALQKKSVRNVIITAKANHAVMAVKQHMNCLHPQCKIVLMCNGALSVRDDLRKVLDEATISKESKEKSCSRSDDRDATNDGDDDGDKRFSLLLASTSNGVYQKSTDDSGNDGIPHIVYAGKGKSYIEQTETSMHFANEMSTLWQQSGLHGKALSSHGMDILLWQKLAANCVINPLTAILRCPNGQLLMEPSFPEYLMGVTEEVAAVAKACGAIDNRLEETSLLQFVGEVIRDTANNRSSMNQDVSSVRETEIDHLNGFIVRKGRQLGIECPVNEELWSRIKDLY